jgi:ribosomal protein S15P/S13E
MLCQEPFWQPVGKFVFAFGELEKQIDWCIGSLLHAEKKSQHPSVASQIRNLCSRIAILEALFRLLTTDKERRSELRSIVKQLRALVMFRNGLLHGPWGAYIEERQTWQKPRTDPKDLRPWALEVTVESIEEHIRLIAQIGTSLSNLVHVVAEEHTPRAL